MADVTTDNDVKLMYIIWISGTIFISDRFDLRFLDANANIDCNCPNGIPVLYCILRHGLPIAIADNEILLDPDNLNTCIHMALFLYIETYFYATEIEIEAINSICTEV